MSMFSLNNRVVVEAYKTDKSLKATVSNGFAMVTQKIALVGLKVLVEAKLADGRIVPAGSTVFIRESLLHTSPWAQSALQSDAVSAPFLIIEQNFIEFVKTPEEQSS